MKKTSASAKEPLLPLIEIKEEKKDSCAGVQVGLLDQAVELKKKEASKPLYLTRYE